MNRNIHRADVHFDYTANFVFRQIGQGHVIAKQEGKAGIIILKIKAFPQALRKLVNKAKYAFVFAAVLPIHQIGFKFQADFLIFRLFQRNRTAFSPVVFQLQDQSCIQLVKAVIQHIHNLIAV